ncbi:MAG: hypothetical protein EXS00_03815 [Phycisphaerales bacterium]|nr:hypothetical protein [Phycisphaerales bacterium]
MARVKINDVEVHLVTQTQEQFAKLGAAVIARFHEGLALPALICAAYAEGMKVDATNDNPMSQACLWCLHEMGIRSLTIDATAGTADIVETVAAGDRTAVVGDPYSKGNIATGRALVTALANFQKRSFRLNGEELPVRLQSREMLGQAMAAITNERRVNEAIHLTSARMFGSLIRGGVARDDPKFLAVMELLSDLGVRAVHIETDKGVLVFEELSESDAQSAAYLQGMDSAGIHASRDRIRFIVAQANAQAAAAQRAGPLANAGSTSAATVAAKPTMMRTTIKRRRRD